MIALSPDMLKIYSEQLYDPYTVRQRQDDFHRWMMFNGNISIVVNDRIMKEFKRSNTIDELKHRIVPLNILYKIIYKLANVYNESPLRRAHDRNESDQDLVHMYEKYMEVNTRMKEANRYFKLYKATLIEIVLTDQGTPSIRNLPRHTYKVWSHSPTTPEKPDLIAKFLILDTDRKKARIAWWTADQHIITDGNGGVDEQMMMAIDNPEGINPYGTLPFIYINSSTYDVNPIPDQDLLDMPALIALLLSDLAFAVKYLSWAIIYTVGTGDTKLEFSPNSVISLDYGPEGQAPQINTVRPVVDIDNVLRYCEFLVSSLLTTKNLSSSAIAGQLTAASPASGVARALDSAESQEDKKDQQAYFRRAEKEMWLKIAHEMVPYWRRTRQLAADINMEFSSTFDLTIFFPEPQIVMTEREMIELANLRVSSGWSTRRRELARMNPEMDDQQLEELMFEIDQDQQGLLPTEEVQDVPDEEEDTHYHQGTKPAIGQGTLHIHELDDGNGFTSAEAAGEGHTHTMPDGSLSSPPIDSDRTAAR